MACGLVITVNVPSALLLSPALKGQTPQALFIHISTDQGRRGGVISTSPILQGLSTTTPFVLLQYLGA
eukprot:1175993-Prorocentrum_minimum.AAC.2